MKRTLKLAGYLFGIGMFAASLATPKDWPFLVLGLVGLAMWSCLAAAFIIEGKDK